MLSLALALCGYLSTTAIGNASLFLVVCVFSIVFKFRKIPKELTPFGIVFLVWGLLGYLLLAANGRYYGAYDLTGSVGLAFPFMFVLGVMSTFAVDKRYREAILWFVAIEVLIGFLEYFLGVRSLIGAEFHGETEFGEDDYLYGNRVFGLSLNSSPFSAKVLIGIVLLCLEKLRHEIKSYHYFLMFWFLSSFYVNFSRTALIASVLALGVFCFLHGKKGLFVFCLAAFFSAAWFAESFLEQFNRGGQTVDYSYRDLIFPAFVNFIYDNPVFGNYGYKYYVSFGSGVYHAHNSYLEVAATSGLFFLILIFVFMFAVARVTALLLVTPILVYSGFQYGVFWGASLYDQLFWCVILSVGRTAFARRAVSLRGFFGSKISIARKRFLN